MKNKKWLSFVEIIIVITIIALIWIVITKISNDSKEKTINVKVKTDLESISNSLLAYSQKENKLPLPEWNKNYYKNSWWYSHEDFNNEKEPAFWVYWATPEKELKNFLTEIPKDPKTNQYYSYGRLRDNLEFEVVWVERKWESYFSKVIWNYKWDRWLIWLVREYNWPYFISDWASSLPFNPEKILLSATDLNWNTFNEKDILEYKGWKILKNWENINFTKSENKYYDLYISDWSIARLDLSSDVKITFWKDNNLFAFIKESNKESKISMFFEAGSAWIFAWNKEDSDSEITLKTQDIVAAVRWTIFKIDSDKQEVIVYKWKVEVTKNNKKEEILWNEKEWEIPYIKWEEKNKSPEKNISLKNTFTTYSYENWKVKEEKNVVLNKSNINNYVWLQNWKYYILEIDEKSWLFKTYKRLDNFTRSGGKSISDLKENEKELFYSEKIFYIGPPKDSCLEIINKEWIEFYNNCEENYWKIFEGYKKDVSNNRTDRNTIDIKNYDNYILDFEMTWEELLKFWNSDWELFWNIFGEKNNCNNKICDLLKIEDNKIYIHYYEKNDKICPLNIWIAEWNKVNENFSCDKIRSIEKENIEINTNKNYELIYKVETKDEIYRTYKLYIFDKEKNEIIFKGRSFVNYERNYGKWSLVIFSDKRPIIFVK